MAIAPTDFTVREATDDDIPAMVALEQKRFGGAGTDVYGKEYFETWRQVNPSGLLVAVYDGRVAGYRYSQYVNFQLADIDRLTTHNAYTDDGFTRTTHVPDGNSINGVTVCSDTPGAGRVLFEAIFKQLVAQNRRYYFGFSRIAGFAAYVHQWGLISGNLELIATWYAMECARRAKGRVWETVAPASNLDLPPVMVDDPVLSKYLKHPGFGVAKILPNWMKDPESLGFGAMVLFKNSSVS